MQNHNATGRSVGAHRPAGRARRSQLDEPFVMLPLSLMDSMGWRCLSSPARKIIDFLLREYMRSAGRENGRLLAPYIQIQAVGVSRRDIAGAFRELEAFGIVRSTKSALRLEGRRGATRYALTWLPTADGALPTNDYKRVSRQTVEAFALEKTAEAKRRRERVRVTG